MNFDELKSNLNTLNKESRIDELEKIKAEIRQQQWYLGVDNSNQVIEIIDKRISELKGEKE